MEIIDLLLQLASSPIPFLGAAAKILHLTYEAIEHVKLYKTQCRDLGRRCVQLLVTVQDNSIGLEGTRIIELGDELEFLILRINRQVTEWSDWTRLRSFLQQGDIKDGVERLNRELDTCLMKFQIGSQLQFSRGNQDLKAMQIRDNFEIREVLQTILRSQEDMRTLLNMHSAPAVEEMMESLQTQLREPDLQPTQEQAFKEGLWMLHENTSKLPPLVDLTGQVNLATEEPFMRASSNDIFIGTWLGREKVALRLPRALANNPEVQDRFQREVAVWRQLHHENVVQLYGIVNINTNVYSVTPWMENGNLGTYVKRSFSVDRLKSLSEVAAGLEYLHNKGIVHGDLRGANVLVSKNGIARLSDFGLSKFFEDCDRDLAPSSSGSLRWTAPEVLKQGGVVSMRSDIWSFGMLCLEIWTGDVPFSSKTDDGVRHQLEQCKHPERPGRLATSKGLDTGMWNFMCQCWEKNPERRPSMNRVKPFLLELRGLTFQTASRKPPLTQIDTSPPRPDTAESYMTTMSTKTARTFPMSTRSQFSSARYTDEPEALRTPQHSSKSPSDSGWSIKGSPTIARKTSGTSWLRSLSIGSPKPPPNIPTSPLSSSSSTLSKGMSARPPRLDLDIISDSQSLFSDHLTSPTRGSPRSSDLTLQPPAQTASKRNHHSADVMDGIVTSGTLEDLVQFLIDTFSSRIHQHFRDTFLMGCADFTTPEDLFAVLSQRFFDAETDKGINLEQKVVIQFNIFLIITYWLKDGSFAPSYESLWKMKFFCENAVRIKSSVMTLADKARDLQQVIETQIEKRHPAINSTMTSGPVLAPAQISPRSLAIGLTLLEGDLYKALHPSDYIMHLTKGQSESIDEIDKTNEKLKAWITDRILHYDIVDQRAGVMNCLTKPFSKECRRLRNFSSSVTIAAALHSAAVENLKLTRKTLTRDMQAKLYSLYDIVKPESNFRGYRDAINDAASPQERDTCIIWLAFHLKELRKVLRSHPATVRIGDKHLINFERYIKFMDRIKEVVHYTPPDLEAHRYGGQLGYLLKTLKDFSISSDTNDEQLARSRKFAAQEESDYRTRKTHLKQLGFRVG